MKLPSILLQNKGLPVQAGFTLIEIVIVIAIVGFLAIFGIIIGADSYARYNFHSEEDIAVSLLQRARSESINNIGGVTHGIYFADPADLILFSGSSYAGSYELKIAKSQIVSYDYSACSGNQVVFAQLSGKTAGCVIKINGKNITINNEGGIDW